MTNSLYHRFIVLFALLVFVSVIHSTLSAASQEGSTMDSSAIVSEKKAILFLGNSLSAGYGIDPDQAFPALIQQKIDSLQWKFEVINAGLSGETSAGGLRRVNWLLRRPIAVLVLELGANDGLRGIPLEATRRNLNAIIKQARKKNPALRVVVAGMALPPNVGERYGKEFQDLFKALARDNNAALIPFLLEGVAGLPELNLADGIHPTPEGHRRVAENVWKVLKPILEAFQP